MSLRPNLRTALALALLSAIAAGAVSAQSRGRHSELMRRKLAHSQKVLEGIALEDYDEIAKNARELKALSEDSEWNAFPDMDYLRYSNEFRTIADDLAQNARAKNLDGMTLSYVQLTMNCVRCHKFVRIMKK